MPKTSPRPTHARPCSSSTRCGDELFPAEQARIVSLLVERVDIGTNRLNFRLRMDGLGGLAREMLSGSIGAAA
jgi:site-specific DNA recombinase